MLADTEYTLLFRLVLVIALLAALPASASLRVEAVGLFKDMAVLRIAGRERVLDSGETSPEGVTLVSATSRAAVVRYQGERITLNLSDRVGGVFEEVTRTRIAISPDELGQYRIKGAINGQYVDFLVDTGASVVALSARHARALGIDYRASPNRGTVITAQGEAKSYFVTLDTVTVGGISARNVQAAVIDGLYPVDVLLGMSFLEHVAIEQREGVLSLVQKF